MAVGITDFQRSVFLCLGSLPATQRNEPSSHIDASFSVSRKELAGMPLRASALLTLVSSKEIQMDISTEVPAISSTLLSTSELLHQYGCGPVQFTGTSDALY